MLSSGYILIAATPISTVITLAAVVVLGIGAQWIAWRLRLPSILLLLLVGFIAGPVTGYLNPDELLQNPSILFAIVSLSVALILFEGGLTLQLSELKESGAPIISLCTIGALITAVMATAAAWFLLGTGFGTALVLGTLLVVTGPTVVGPLLRHIRPIGRVATVAKWEGIVIDPVGATFAVLALASIEAVLLGSDQPIPAVFAGLIKTLFWGGLFGVLGAWPTFICLRRYWIPDHLQSPVLLMIVVACFAASNYFQAESGLFAVTLMGVLLVNQAAVPMKHIIEFKENLRVLLISFLFIILAARVRWEALNELGWGAFAFVAVLMLVIRPVAVVISTIRSGLTWRERVFLCWLAPRGIVAAALASVFALALEGLRTGGGDASTLLRPGDAEKLVPVTFLVIVSTVTIYGLTAAPLARWLGLSTANPQGVLIAGAHSAARAIAKSLLDAGFAVMVVDTNRDNIHAAKMAGIPTFFASILSEHALEEVELGGIGRLLAMTRNDEVNSLAALHFSEVFGRAEVYQLFQTTEGPARTGTSGEVIRGRRLFDEQATFGCLDERLEGGAVVKRTSLTAEFGYDTFVARYGESALLLFVVSESGTLQVNTIDKPVTPKSGDAVIALVDPVEENASTDPVKMG